MKFKSPIELDAPPTQDNHILRKGDMAPLLIDRAELASYEDPPGSGLYPGLVGKNAIVTDDYGISTPDYENMAAENLMPALAPVGGGYIGYNTSEVFGEFTVDNAGFIQYTVSDTLGEGMSVDPRGSVRVSLSVNGKTVGTNVLTPPIEEQVVKCSGVIPVSPGDVVRAVARCELYEGDWINSITGNGAQSNPNGAYGHVGELYTPQASSGPPALERAYATCYYVPPKFVKVIQPKVSEDFMNVAMVPDYAAMETTNRISANDGGWTWMADRTGYVQCTINASPAYESTFEDDQFLKLAIIINEKECYAKLSDEYPMHNIVLMLSEVIPVSAGDMVQLMVSVVGPPGSTAFVINDMSCYFIPPRFITAQSTELIDPTDPKYETVQVVPDWARAQYGANLVYNDPDYSNVGSSRIGGAIPYTLEGAWTADKSGFIYARVYSYISPVLPIQRAVIGEVKINGNIVTTFESGDGLGQVTGGHRLMSDGVFPINVGDVITTRIYRVGSVNEDNPLTTAWEPGTVYLRHYVYYIPPKAIVTKVSDVEVIDPADPKYETLQVVPDWTNMESINRITENDGQWTAERTGWISWGCSDASHRVNGNAPSGMLIAILLINGAYAVRQSHENSLNGQYYGHYFGGVAPVKAGDQVSILTRFNFSTTPSDGIFFCYFIPTKAVVTNPSALEFIDPADPQYASIWNSPDYAKLDYNNLWVDETPPNSGVTKFGSWTADKAGFVSYSAKAEVTEAAVLPAGGITLTAFVNSRAIDITALMDAPVGETASISGIIPVSEGDKITLRMDPAGTGGPVAEAEMECNFIPLKVNVAVSEEIASSVLVPDYAKMEAANRIPKNNGVWYADRIGFVSVQMNGRQDSGSAKCYVRINDKIVSGQNTAASGQFANQNGVYQVNVGDKIQLSTDATSDLVFKCFFIPPKLVAKDVIDPTQPEYESVQVVPNYAKVETGANLMSNYANMGSHEDSNGDVYTLYSAEWTATRTGFAKIQYDYEQDSPGDMMSYEIAVDGVLVKSIRLSMDGGTKFSQTETIPVSTGQTVAFKSRCMNEFSNTVNCEFIPPLASVTKTPIINVSEDYANVVVMPDYDNIEKTNLLSSVTKSGSPSVGVNFTSAIYTADRFGWLRYIFSFNLASTTSSAINTVIVNEEVIYAISARYAPANTTGLIQVKPGDRVQFKRSTNQEDTLAQMSVYFIPPMFVSLRAPLVSEDFMNVAMVPDYDNEVTTNLLSAGSWGPTSNFFTYKSSVWTADRVGWVRCFINFTINGGATWAENVILVNGKEVSRSGATPAVYIYGDIVMVKPGDTVQIIRQSDSGGDPLTTIFARFIPPKFITQQTPVITVSGASYSNAEQLTGETWVDGKPIYRKNFSKTVAVTTTSFTNTKIYEGVTGDTIVKFDNMMIVPGKTTANTAMTFEGWEIPLPCALDNKTIQHMIHPTYKHTAYISGTWGGDADGNVTVTGTIYYTKTTD